MNRPERPHRPLRPGRPNDIAANKEENQVAIPNSIVVHILGAEGEKGLTRAQIAEKLDDIVKLSTRKTKELQTNCALALYYIKMYETYKAAGYLSWEQYITAMTIQHQTFSSDRQADRYVAAVQTLIVELGFDISLMMEYGPSPLGELAQSGLLTDKKTATHWIYLLESRKRSEMREEIRNAHKLLDPPTPEPVGTKAQFGGEVDDDDMDAPKVQTVPSSGTPFTPSEVSDAIGSSPMDDLNVLVIELQNEDPEQNSFMTIITRGDGLELCRYPSLRVNISHKLDTEVSGWAREKKMERDVEKLKKAFGTDE